MVGETGRGHKRLRRFGFIVEKPVLVGDVLQSADVVNIQNSGLRKMK